MDYKYNIRGWLKDINNVESLGNDLFAFKINYNSLFAATLTIPNNDPDVLYNGNICQTVWRTSTDNQIRAYRYDYDDLNRLLEANYVKILPFGQNYWASPTNSYNERLSYDNIGNIIGLTRNGNLDSDNSVIVIDQLLYSYDDMNRLIKVVDYTGNPSGFKEGVYLGDAFIYDKYGNLIEDKNKGFRGVTYNHLNLPKKMTFGSNKHITYLYNALGQKLLKQVTDNTTTITTEYQSGFQYENEVLKFFATAEGYVNVSAGRYNYVYNYTDHLGNVRLSYTSDRLLGVRVIEENNYYPFGLKHNGYNNISPPNSVYKYKFNGMEHQDELGLNVYDFGARNYMPDLGRWTNIDPLAEASRRWTPYNYAYNNPVYFIDPDGMQAMSTGYGSVDFETSNIAMEFTSYKGLGKSTGELNESSTQSPDDVRFRDKEGNLIATYYTDKADDDVYLPVSAKETNINLNEQLEKVGMEDVDVVGIGGNWDFTFVMGGGKSIEAVYFLDGKDVGSYEFFETTRQNVGIDGGVGVYGIFADFHGDDSQFTMSDYEGRSFSISAGVKGPWIGSYSKFWAPKPNIRDGSGFKSLFNKESRLWSGYTVGGGVGAGLKWSKQNTNIYNK